MDYRKFLGRRDELVLPYFGGLHVDAGGRRLRLGARLERGFWRFEVSGRQAKPLERVAAPELGEFPRLRGHHASGYLFESGSVEHSLELIDADPPAELAPCSARRVHGGFVLFECADFEGEAEDAARRALEDERGIADVPGVSASLRAAFAFALASRVGRALAVPVAPREIAGQALALATGGRDAAAVLLRAIEERRRQERQRLVARETPPPPARAPTHGAAFDRISGALDAAGASLLDARPVAAGFEVTWRFAGQRIISLVAPDSLRVIDAGFCLDGEDDLVTLDSLPSVLREAIDTHQLNVTRW